MDLFPSKTERLLRFLRGLLPILLLLIVCFVFATSIDRTSADTIQKEQSTLTQALTRGAIHSYALTGRYPETLDRLLAESGITYDAKSFLIEYVPTGSNLMPMITVLPRNKNKGGTP